MARCVAALGTIAANAGLAEGTAFRVAVTGPIAFEAASSDGEVVATLRTDTATFTRLVMGRSSADRAAVVIEGDRATAERVLGAMAITP